VRRCAASGGSWSPAASGLTHGGRKPVRLVGLKGCLGRILLWRYDKLVK
jgi:hypothetical protein